MSFGIIHVWSDPRLCAALTALPHGLQVERTNNLGEIYFNELTDSAFLKASVSVGKQMRGS
jgi:hypothetical protein